MIYLIASSAFVSGWKNNEYETIFKIGYCRDDSVKNRSSAYITENPTIEVLYTIPLGDLQDEINLHHHFKHLKKDYGREWFKFDKEIIEFFKSHTTKESLQELTPFYSTKTLRKIILEEKDKTNKIGRTLNIVINSDLEGINYMLAYEDLVNSFNGDLNLESLKDRFPEIDLDSMIPSNEIQEYLEKFESYSIYKEAMTYLCSLKRKVGKSVYGELLNFVSPDYSFPIRALGINIIKSLNYQKNKLEDRIDEVISNYYEENNIKDEIYSVFEIGERYTKVFIKETLKKIYSKYKYSKAPKSTNLVKYYKVKPVLFYDKETGKRDHGFEIIEKL